MMSARLARRLSVLAISLALTACGDKDVNRLLSNISERRSDIESHMSRWAIQPDDSDICGRMLDRCLLWNDIAVGSRFVDIVAGNETVPTYSRIWGWSVDDSVQKGVMVELRDFERSLKESGGKTDAEKELAQKKRVEIALDAVRAVGAAKL